jgi:alpha-tubulin suppressor-like RCC1 family protein
MRREELSRRRPGLRCGLRQRGPGGAAVTAVAVAAAAATLTALALIALALTSGAAAASPAKTVMRGWGTNTDGELGHGNRGPFSETPVSVRLPKGVIVTSVRAGCHHSVALTTVGRVLTWGANTYGQLGDGNTASRERPVYAKLPKRTKIRDVRAGCFDTIALTTTGRVLAWGLNGDGQLGDGTTRSRHVPVYVRLPKRTRVTAISAGCNHNLALTSSGRVLAWGLNQDGEVGDGTRRNRHAPVQVKLPGGAKGTGVTAGCLHSFAQTSNGGLFAWGNNSEGQLGDGNTTSTDTPVEIFFLTRGRPLGRITGLFAGCQHTIALFSGGGVLTWGGNPYGQLGNGTTTNSDKPVGVSLPAGVTVTAVSAGCYDSFALTKSGSVLAWGYDSEGQLGDGLGIARDTPVAVSLPAGFSAVALGAGPGAQHSFVIGRS